MHRVGGSRRWQAPRRVRRAGIGLGIAALMVVPLAACTSTGERGGSSRAAQNSKVSDHRSVPPTTTEPPSSPTTTTPAPVPAVIRTSPPGGENVINPTDPVKVNIAHGKLTKVVMTNPAGERVSGAFAAGRDSWHTTEVLGYSKTYKIVAHGVNESGRSVRKTSTLTTLTPDNMTLPYMQRTGGYALKNGATYGVGIVPIVHFDEPISDKAAAEKTLHVKTSTPVTGSWYWSDDQNVYYRPKNYWPAGTKVTITAKVYGVEVSDGLYGQSDVSVSFRIGRKQVTVADDTRKGPNRIKVYNSEGKVIRKMSTAMGMHGGVTVKGNYINFYTLDGTYTVLEHDNPAYMSSDSYGLPSSNPHGYKREPIYWSTKISVGGIYLHELTTTIWDQKKGNDVSHGCLNLNTSNAKWFYKHSIIGDPVVVKGAKGAPKIQLWQGGEWSIPWSQWRAGSALH